MFNLLKIDMTMRVMIFAGDKNPFWWFGARDNLAPYTDKTGKLYQVTHMRIIQWELRQDRE